MSVQPHFFVVGAQKAGTTSLHDWLVRQPDICLPVIKETQFFTYPENFEKGVKWYFRQFPVRENDAIYGEICPDYMFFPAAAGRMKTVCSEPKIIFIFRHPIDRAFSHYQMTVRDGFETLPFCAALLCEDERLGKGLDFDLAHFSYMARGRYVEQIQRFREVYTESEFLFVKFEDLIDAGEVGTQTYRKICEFIGVDSAPVIPDRTIKSNPASEPKSKFLRDFLYGSSPMKRVLGRLVPNKDLRTKVGYILDKLNQREIHVKDAFEVPEDILSAAKEEILRLQEVSGLDLNDWLSREYVLRKTD